LKGSVHSIVNGYNVAVLKDGVAGATEPDNWRPSGEKKNAPTRPCTFYSRKCTETQLTEWRKEIYTGHKGGPE